MKNSQRGGFILGEVEQVVKLSDREHALGGRGHMAQNLSLIHI